MAEFITKCPHCSTDLQAQEEWIGMEVECPQCRKTFAISVADTDETKSPPPPFQGVATPPSTPPLFKGVIAASTTSTQRLNSCVKQKLDLYVNAMTVATFLFVVLCPVIYCTGLNLKPDKFAILFSHCILIAIAIGSFYAAVALEGYLLWEAIRAIPEKRRRQHPVASAILLLMPGWCYVWNFFTMPRTAIELRDEIISRGKQEPKNLISFAIAYCIMTVFMILIAITTPMAFEHSGSGAGIFGTVCFCIILVLCTIGAQYRTFSTFAKAVAIIKSEEE